MHPTVAEAKRQCQLKPENNCFRFLSFAKSASRLGMIEVALRQNINLFLSIRGS